MKNIMKAWFSRYASQLTNSAWFRGLDELQQGMEESRSTQSQTLNSIKFAPGAVLPSSQYTNAFQSALRLPRTVNERSANEINRIEIARMDISGSIAPFTSGRPQLPNYDMLVRPFSRIGRPIPAPFVSARVRRNFGIVSSRSAPPRIVQRPGRPYMSHAEQSHQSLLQSSSRVPIPHRVTNTARPTAWQASQRTGPFQTLLPGYEAAQHRQAMPMWPNHTSQDPMTPVQHGVTHLLSSPETYIPLPRPYTEAGAPPGYSTWDRVPGREALANHDNHPPRLSPTAYMIPAWENAMDADSFFSRLSVPTPSDAEAISSMQSRPTRDNPIVQSRPTPQSHFRASTQDFIPRQMAGNAAGVADSLPAQRSSRGQIYGSSFAPGDDLSLSRYAQPAPTIAAHAPIRSDNHAHQGTVFYDQWGRPSVQQARTAHDRTDFPSQQSRRP
ncbi:MAG: hypothetical protein M1828_004356 [Chrysothrix sp. TS-e1954]|nr:MAG: hypothetical protein M1828_004356 [Chrysothrix sp. TS-e1954]